MFGMCGSVQQVQRSNRQFMSTMHYTSIRVISLTSARIISSIVISILLKFLMSNIKLLLFLWCYTPGSYVEGLTKGRVLCFRHGLVELHIKQFSPPTSSKGDQEPVPLFSKLCHADPNNHLTTSAKSLSYKTYCDSRHILWILYLGIVLHVNACWI